MRTCAGVAHQQHVQLAAGARPGGLLAPRDAPDEHQRGGQFHEEKAVQLGADAGQDLVAPLERPPRVCRPEAAELRLLCRYYLMKGQSQGVEGSVPDFGRRPPC